MPRLAVFVLLASLLGLIGGGCPDLFPSPEGGPCTFIPDEQLPLYDGNAEVCDSGLICCPNADGIFDGTVNGTCVPEGSDACPGEGEGEGE